MTDKVLSSDFRSNAGEHFLNAYSNGSIVVKHKNYGNFILINERVLSEEEKKKYGLDSKN